jgi:hypothetical protein
VKAVALTLVVSVCASGCMAGVLAPSGKSTPQNGTQPAAVRCLDVPAGLQARIADGANDLPIQPIEAAAVRSDDYHRVFMVAMRFDAPGGDPEVGVWATGSLRAGKSTLRAVDAFASEFTVYPTGDSSVGDHGVDQAVDCLS